MNRCFLVRTSYEISAYRQELTSNRAIGSKVYFTNVSPLTKSLTKCPYPESNALTINCVEST